LRCVDVSVLGQVNRVVCFICCSVGSTCDGTTRVIAADEDVVAAEVLDAADVVLDLSEDKTTAVTTPAATSTTTPAMIPMTRARRDRRGGPAGPAPQGGRKDSADLAAAPAASFPAEVRAVRLDSGPSLDRSS
jgi:hypothetical protein